MEELARVAAVVAALVMFGLGVDLTPADFARVVRHPRVLLFGLFNQFVVLPAVTLLLCVIARLDAALTLGFMVLAACPGSAPSNLMTQLAGGNRALSVTMTGITSAVSFLTIPAAIAVASFAANGARVDGGPILAHAVRILVLCGLPLGAGMLLRHWRPTPALALARLFPPFCLLAIVGVIGATLWLQRREVSAALGSVGALALLLNLLTLGSSFATARLAKADRASGVALGLECSMHNGVLGVYVCVTLLAGKASVMPTLAYSLLMWVTAPLLVVALRRAARGHLPPGAPAPTLPDPLPLVRADGPAA